MRPFIPYRAGKRQPKPRVRSNFGCKNCLAKRVKCDEVRPACGRCVKAKVQCPGPRTPAERKAARKDSSSPSTKAASATPPATVSSSSPTTTTTTTTATATTKTTTTSPPATIVAVAQEAEPTEIVQQDEETTPVQDFNIFQAITVGMHSSHIEGETLDRFITRIVPCMGIFFDARFFTQWIMPATQGNEQVFNATLAVTAFHDLPMTDIWTTIMPPRRYQRYQKALEWYRKSLKQSMQSPPDNKSPQSVALALLTITLYLGIELRQMNWRTQEGLVQAAFSITYSARSSVRKSGNFAILLCLSLIMDFTVVNAVNPACVPREHFSAALSVARQLCADCKATENYILRFELYSIMYDVNIILDRGQGSDFELECRMQSWLAHLGRYEGGLPMDFKARIPALRCRFLFMQLQIAWETYLYGTNINRDSFESRLSRVLAIHEINEGNTRLQDNRNMRQRPSWSLETMIIPSCIWVAWYWRAPSVYVRIRRLFADYQEQGQPEQVKLIQAVLEYVMELVSTPYDKPTRVELELYGQKPQVLQHWQNYRYIDHLLWKAGISEGGRSSIPSRPQISQDYQMRMTQ